MTKALEAFALAMLDEHLSHCVVRAAAGRRRRGRGEDPRSIGRPSPGSSGREYRRHQPFDGTNPTNFDGTNPTTKEKPMSTATYTVTGMTCDHCVAHVTEEVSAIPGVTGVAAHPRRRQAGGHLRGPDRLRPHRRGRRRGRRLQPSPDPPPRQSHFSSPGANRPSGPHLGDSLPSPSTEPPFPASQPPPCDDAKGGIRRERFPRSPKPAAIPGVIARHERPDPTERGRTKTMSTHTTATQQQESVQLDISGMTCASCAARIEKKPEQAGRRAGVGQLRHREGPRPATGGDAQHRGPHPDRRGQRATARALPEPGRRFRSTTPPSCGPG